MKLSDREVEKWLGKKTSLRRELTSKAIYIILVLALASASYVILPIWFGEAVNQLSSFK